MYIFPGVGLAACHVKATQIPDKLFTVAARALANSLSDSERMAGMVFPAVSRIREVTAHVATAVAQEAVDAGLAQQPPADGVVREEDVRAGMYEPVYRPLVSISDYGY